MRTIAIASVAVAIALLSAGPVTAASILDGKTPTRSSETVGPAAAGDPKPYLARRSGECSGSGCFFSFGKKAAKSRTIEWISCGVATENGVARIGGVFIDNISETVGFFSTVSRAVEGTQETAVLDYKNPVSVPPGKVLGIFISVTGDAVGGECAAGGTIR